MCSIVTHLYIPTHITLDRIKRHAAQHIEEAYQRLGRFEEFAGADGVVVAGVYGDGGEGAFVVEEGAAGGVGHCGCSGVSEGGLA